MGVVGWWVWWGGGCVGGSGLGVLDGLVCVWWGSGLWVVGVSGCRVCMAGVIGAWFGRRTVCLVVWRMPCLVGRRMPCGRRRERMPCGRGGRGRWGALFVLGCTVCGGVHCLWGIVCGCTFGWGACLCVLACVLVCSYPSLPPREHPSPPPPGTRMLDFGQFDFGQLAEGEIGRIRTDGVCSFLLFLFFFALFFFFFSIIFFFVLLFIFFYSSSISFSSSSSFFWFLSPNPSTPNTQTSQTPKPPPFDL